MLFWDWGPSRKKRTRTTRTTRRNDGIGRQITITRTQVSLKRSPKGDWKKEMTEVIRLPRRQAAGIIVAAGGQLVDQDLLVVAGQGLLVVIEVVAIEVVAIEAVDPLPNILMIGPVID
jgi:hypothetical protein